MLIVLSAYTKKIDYYLQNAYLGNKYVTINNEIKKYVMSVIHPLRLLSITPPLAMRCRFSWYELIYIYVALLHFSRYSIIYPYLEIWFISYTYYYGVWYYNQIRTRHGWKYYYIDTHTFCQTRVAIILLHYMVYNHMYI